MREIVWRIIARIVSRPAVADWIIKRAQRTPYTHITSRGGEDVYMWRWWLFNAYGRDDRGDPNAPRWTWLPSIRVHHICRADNDKHLHDHPWNARTIVLRGNYIEERPGRTGAMARGAFAQLIGHYLETRDAFNRQRGYSGRVLYGQYHRISAVPPEGVYTLWFTWRYRGTWGFDVNGVKVPWREYLGVE